MSVSPFSYSGFCLPCSHLPRLAISSSLSRNETFVHTRTPEPPSSKTGSRQDIKRYPRSRPTFNHSHFRVGRKGVERANDGHWRLSFVRDTWILPITLRAAPPFMEHSPTP